AAAEWVHVAPNAGRYHRLAAAVTLDDVVPTRPVDTATQPFYQPYRRDVAAMVRQETLSGNDAVVLLEDHVAISRPDGSVALYVHTARTTAGESLPAIPPGAQIVAQRVIHPEGAVANVGSALQAGDIVDQEYVIHYVGDGGIPEHCEAFQFVFGNFNERVLQARFVVLTPAEQSDRGAVITTGDAPEMSAAIEGSWLVRQWNMKPLHATNKGTAVVRVVEQENGWSVPSSAEHQRRIETIHPKPLPEES
ncbi:MAG TPA: hypothetical protein VKV04_23180, partial [Verrucomicrobiae bacterium]|nr:hypothetical protein [Verrucomicrobiae bacterium]